MEEWIDIEGYEGLYQVSNEGRVKSLKRVIMRSNGESQTINEKYKAFAKTKKNHLYVQLCKNGIDKHHYIHRLVAEAFIPNPNNYAVVHHKDKNPTNNRAENLEWISDEKHKGMHTKERFSKKVYQYTVDGKLVKIWASCSEAAKVLNYSVSPICTCCRGGRFFKKRNGERYFQKCETYKGFKWSYKQM